MANNLKVRKWLFTQEEYNTKEKRSQAKEIHITEPGLEGKLNLSDFTYRKKTSWKTTIGVKIYVYPELVGKINFENKPSHAQIFNLINAQGWLDDNYPQAQRNEIRKLYAGNKNLIGALEINGFRNLTELNCDDNKLTVLNLENCPNLEKIDCRNNQLTVLKLNCSSLTQLSCENNKLTKLNFNELQNCQFLFLDNNPFTGILEVQKNLSKLKLLSIKDTKFTDLNILLPRLEKITIYCEEKLNEKLKEYEKKSSQIEIMT